MFKTEKEVIPAERVGDTAKEKGLKLEYETSIRRRVAQASRNNK